MLLALYLFVIFNVLNCVRAYNDQLKKSSDSVLCRNCGRDIVSTDSIISKLSPVSLHSFSETVFNKEEVVVQVLAKDSELQFAIITANASTCVGVGEWQDDDYWFPGYRWKLCGCSECGVFIGWLFETTDPFSIVIPEKFFGLIPAYLISKSFTDTLVKYPELETKNDQQNLV